jgi:hypothetical protein
MKTALAILALGGCHAISDDGGVPVADRSSTESASCAAPTATYRDVRKGKADGGDSKCFPGTFEDPGYTFDIPLSDLPGCKTTRQTSADGCTHTTVTVCKDGPSPSTCTETIVFVPDLSSYSGTSICRGTYDGEDGIVPYECDTTVEGTRKP